MFCSVLQIATLRLIYSKQVRSSESDCCIEKIHLANILLGTNKEISGRSTKLEERNPPFPSNFVDEILGQSVSTNTE